MLHDLRDLRIPTARLLLRTFSQDDLAALLLLVSQAEITTNLPDWAMTAEQCEQWLAWHETNQARFDSDKPALPLAICLPDGELIGWLGIWPKPSVHVDPPEVMYALSHAYRGRGYVSEAVRAATQWLFGLSPLPQLMAVVKPSNPESRRVVLRSGFTASGTVRCDDDGWFDYFVLQRAEATGEQPSA
ncbi:GNAT family N-acetyltransferase [Jeongeupia chitinilytica]|uniref:N-acetyltransferase n=1 Tax=Jeongeupia chitinilytica TaxID=1041641 RepID=A0ABQ3GZM3_9NEIS|nr:GNAT family N-acetyltransferase [Jeongeupia chitinilytica]GHD60104.1 N-acetyltransferase [Jeongeupia chitinilytica]